MTYVLPIVIFLSLVAPQSAWAELSTPEMQNELFQRYDSGRDYNTIDAQTQGPNLDSSRNYLLLTPNDEAATGVTGEVEMDAFGLPQMTKPGSQIEDPMSANAPTGAAEKVDPLRKPTATEPSALDSVFKNNGYLR